MAAPPPFFTRDEELHFRRLTWLIATLSPADASPPTRPSASLYGPLQAELSWLSNLLVRHHEVVAVMPYRDGSSLVVNRSSPAARTGPTAATEGTQLRCSEGVGGRCIITSNFRRDSDVAATPPASTPGLSASLHMLDSVAFQPDDSLSAATGFKQHVELVISLLKKIVNACELDQPSLSNSIRNDIATLHVYILRSCLNKIKTRAAYHCRAMTHDKESKKRPASESMGVGVSAVDFMLRVPPPESWHELMETMADNFFQDAAFHGQFLAMLKIWTSHVGYAVDHNDSWWASNVRIDDTQMPKITSYAPNSFELKASDFLHHIWRVGLAHKNSGFYLSPAGRRSYHEVFTITLASALFLLKVLSREDVATQSLEGTDGRVADVSRLISLCKNFLVTLQGLVFQSGILPLHLEWYLRQLHDASADDSSETRQDTTTTIGIGVDASGNRSLPEDASEKVQDTVDTVDDAEKKFMYDEDQEENQDAAAIPEFAYLTVSMDRQFPIKADYVRALIRWLRLTTYHQYSVESLLSGSTAVRIKRLKVYLVRTSIPALDPEMESLSTFLKPLVPDDTDREELKWDLYSLPNVDKFAGTYHCEAILLSLYLFAKSGLDHPGVPMRLKQEAGQLFPLLCTVSKACCPVCTALWSTFSELLNTPITIGSHETYSACCLPPWLPRQYAEGVVDQLNHRVGILVTKKLNEIRKRRYITRGSQSPQILIDQREPDSLELEPKMKFLPRNKRQRVGDE